MNRVLLIVQVNYLKPVQVGNLKKVQVGSGSCMSPECSSGSIHIELVQVSYLKFQVHYLKKIKCVGVAFSYFCHSRRHT